MSRLKRPLNKDAIKKADDEFYTKHPELEKDGKRIPLSASDPSQMALQEEWKQLYLKCGGELEDDRNKLATEKKKPADPQQLCPQQEKPRIYNNPIDDPAVKASMKKAWEDSEADNPKKRHEEGGYIVKNSDGSYSVERWPRGKGNRSIAPPARDKDGKYNGKEVIGEFHTHPNPPLDEKGDKWTQGGHKGDWDGIKAEKYPGDSYIISKDSVWKVPSDGNPSKDKDGNEIPYGTRKNLIDK